MVVKILRSLAPSILAALTISGSTLLAPAIEFNVVLENDARKIRKIFASSPSPNQIIEIGIHAIGGIGRIILNNGLKIASAIRYHPIKSPSATPTNEPTINPIITRNRLYPACARILWRPTFPTMPAPTAFNTSKGPGMSNPSCVVCVPQYHKMINAPMETTAQTAPIDFSDSFFPFVILHSFLSQHEFPPDEATHQILLLPHQWPAFQR